ncbi:hypothetical protein BAE44_0025176 [Dichanthelium oligosanthes]|uniref:Uncharacterized protein n=1 Tax=Dichanthelium oligosanthes TaxID=888268 RepID=A0A1E5ULR7_9POAL|nr:hypothetical protein BAE44_0025176 [Dichanthelium oligosanthes]
MEREPGGSAALWGHWHLPLLARAGSKESLEYILQALWRTRRTGLDAADRAIARDALQLSSDAELDPLLVCLRILIRRCVNKKVSKDDIPNLFPDEVPPELQKLLTLLLQKFQPEWQEDASKDQASALNSSTAECQLNQNGDTSEQPAAPNAEYQNGTASVEDSIKSGKKEVKKFPLAKDSLDKMLKDLFPTKDQMPIPGSNNGHEEVAGSTSKT